jgi:hypothetical protein
MIDGDSTHIDEDGKVIAVIDDGDLGVYQHKKTKTETLLHRTKLKRDNENMVLQQEDLKLEKLGLH